METNTIKQSTNLESDFDGHVRINSTPVPGGIECHQKIISGIQKEFVELFVRMRIAWIDLRVYKSLSKSFKILRMLDSTRRNVLGEKRINKIAQVDGKCYWDLYTPGYNSKAFAPFIRGEANRIVPLDKKSNRFTNIFIAITKKCPLQCEHCFEWDALNGRETLMLQDIKNIVLKFQHKGTGQIQLTGGEPLLKVNDIVEIIQSAKPETEFWVLTSGYNLTFENAKKLKNAGLAGIVVSLDHFDSALHNQFRGFAKSFEWAHIAVRNAIEVNLVTALSICVTKSFVSESNLMTYAELAKKWGVAFIQILEPRAVGHYKEMDVMLKQEHQTILEDFYLKMNYDEKYKKYPIVTYHGYHQRRIGCFASGNRNLYIDTDGDIHACPFCQTKRGSAIAGNLDSLIERLQETGCHKFEGVLSMS